MGDGLSPIEKLDPNGGRCLPADQVIELPVGRWLFHLRHAKRNLVSYAPMGVAIRAPLSDDLYREFILELRPAATLDFTKLMTALGPDERLAVYLSNEKTDLPPMLFPVRRDERSVRVPAGMRVVVLLLRHHTVINMTDPLALATGEVRDMSVPPLSSEKGNLVSWVDVRDDLPDLPDDWGKIPAPVLRLEAAGKTYAPLLAPRSGFEAKNALLFFRDIPLGTYKVTARGPLWTTGEQPVEIARPGVVVPLDGLKTAPAAALEIDWSISAPPPDATANDCGPVLQQEGKEAEVASAGLYACDGLQEGGTPNSIDRAKCKRVATPVALESRARRASFHGAPPGVFLAGVKEPGFPVGYKVVSLIRGQERHASLTFDAFTVLGRVTLDDAPLKGRLEFRTGTGQTDDDGRYLAALRDRPGLSPIRIYRCSDNTLLYTDLPHTPLEPNVPHDIHITSNVIDISVANAQTHRPVAKAAIHVSATSARGTNVVSELTADDEGTAAFRNAPTTENLTVCANAAHYEQTCSAAFELGEARKRSVRVELPPKPYRGRLLTDHRFQWGMVAFVTPDGNVREKVFFQGEGTFDTRFQHANPEYVVVASDLPMFVAPLPDTATSDLQIPIPTGASRRIEVSIKPPSLKRDAFVGLVLGRWYIPAEVFFMHQSMRGLQPTLLGGGPFGIPDLLAAGPIKIILGPAPSDLPPDFSGPDLFLLPQFAPKLITKEVDASNRVVF